MLTKQKGNISAAYAGVKIKFQLTEAIVIFNADRASGNVNDILGHRLVFCLPLLVFSPIICVAIVLT